MTILIGSHNVSDGLVDVGRLEDGDEVVGTGEGGCELVPDDVDLDRGLVSQLWVPVVSGDHRKLKTKGKAHH